MTRATPNLFLVGAAKAGTTTLHALLDGHPDIYMSTVKEPHFFSDAREAPNIAPIRDEDTYRSLFAPGRAASYRGESSPSYLWDAEAATRIARWTPDAAIVVSLRDPVDRAYSHYLMDVREGLQTAPFDVALRDDAARPEKGWGVSHLYFELGMYAAQADRYLTTFGRDRVHVLFFEDLIRDADAVTASLFRFLRIPDAPTSKLAARNVYERPRGRLGRAAMRARALRSAARRYLPRRARSALRGALLARGAAKPPLDPDLEAHLVHRYAADVADLEGVLGRPVPWARWCRP